MEPIGLANIRISTGYAQRSPQSLLGIDLVHMIWAYFILVVILISACLLFGITKYTTI